MGPDTLDERFADSAEILALAEELQNPAMTARALMLRVRAAREAGRFDEGDRCLRAAGTIVEDLAEPTLLWMLNVNRSTGLTFAGQLGAAERLVEEAGATAEASGQPDGRLWLALQWFGLRLEQGRLGELLDLLLEVVDRWPRVPVLRAVLARTYCEVGRPAEARRLLAELAEDGFRHPVDNVYLRGLTDCAAVSAALVERTAARELAEILSPYADQVVATTPAISGSVEYYLGLLAAALDDLDAALAHFAAAEAVHARVGAPLWVARTRLEWAGVLLRHGGIEDGSRATSLLNAVRATAVDHRLPALEHRVDRLLAGHGAI